MSTSASPIAELADPQPPRPMSPARVEANRRNALKSTGPRTDLGKRRARMNALKHGLTAKVVDFAADEAKAADRADSLRDIYRPRAVWGDFACRQAARASVLLERAGDRAEAMAESASIDAESPERWAEGRRLEVARLVKKLARDPILAVTRLMDCPRGIDWLVGQWQLLRSSAEVLGEWDDEQADLALGLLRLSRHQRNIKPIGAYALAFRGGPMPATLGEMARFMIRRLEELRPIVEEADEARRLATVAGVTDEYAPEARKARRYESSLVRRMAWFVNLLDADRAAAAEARPEERNEPKLDVEVRNEPEPEVEARNEPNAEAEARNEPKAPAASIPATETKPTPPHPQPAKKNRPDPARALRKARALQRRRAA